MNKSKVKSTKATRSPKKQSVAGKPDLLDKIERHLVNCSRIYFIGIMCTAVLFTFLMFNIRITDAADDALYIQAGYNWATDFFNFYYTFTAPLYCLFLALPIAIFGVNLPLLKVFSALFFVAGIYFYYRAFRRRVPYGILFPALLLTALNGLFLFYASQTYTETFTLMLSGLFFMVWFNLDDATGAGADIKRNWKKFLLVGLTAVLLYLARNVATMVVAVLVLYFLFYRKYATAAYSAAAFGFFILLYQKVIVPLCWGHLNLGSRFSGQGSIIFNKDAYNPGLGQEDLSGLIVRVFENAKIYFSQFFELICLKSDATPKSYLFVVILLLFVALGIGFAIAKKQRRVVAAALYVAAFLGATFISLHTFWGQARFIMIYIPLIVMVVFYGITMLFKTPYLRWLQWAYPIAVGMLLLVNLGKTADKVRENMPVLQKNLSGNKYAGWTPDWVNYFKMSEYAAKKLPKDAVVACRKASMSFVYTGKNFSGIGGVPSATLDSALHPDEYKQKFLGVILSEKMLSNVTNALFPTMRTIVLGDNKWHFTYDVPESLYNQCVAEMKRYDVPFFTEPQAMADSIRKKFKESYAVYPDDLLYRLKKSNVQYVIVASLRQNPKQKTENTINTVRRYLYFIENKYPGTFRQVHRIGSDDGEPATLYEVHYPPEITGNNQ